MGRRDPRAGALNPVKRTVTTVVVLAAITCIVLLALLDQIQGFQATQPPQAPPRQTPPASESPTSTDGTPEADDLGEPVPGEASGRVQFSDGSAAAGVEIAISILGQDGELPRELRVTTDADGAFALRVGDGGITTIAASLGPLSASIENDPSAAGVRVTLRFPATFDLRGRVQRTDNRAGIARAVVSCGGHESPTDAEGAFALVVPSSVVTDGRAEIRVGASGYESLVDLTPWGRPAPHYRDLTFRLTPR